MAKILVIADDYTGALDTGAQFASGGLRVCVITAERLLAQGFANFRQQSLGSGAAKEKNLATSARTLHEKIDGRTIDCLFFLKAQGSLEKVEHERTFVWGNRNKRTFSAENASKNDAPNGRDNACNAAISSCLADVPDRRQTTSAHAGDGGATRGAAGDDNGCLYACKELTIVWPFNEFDVIAVDTETRHAPQTLAFDVVYTLTRKAVELGIDYFYKKTDSALRGNIGAELSAMLEACADTTLSFAPAYPKSGRVTRGGIHYIEGTAVNESVFANDPFSPVKYGEVASIVKEQTDIGVASRSVGTYRAPEGGPNIDQSQSQSQSQSQNPILDHELKTRAQTYESPDPQAAHNPLIEIYDAESDDDLLQLGHYLKAAGKLRSLAGCAGFAGILPEIYGIDKYTSPVGANRPDVICPAPASSIRPKNLLIVTGSINPITMSQLASAKDKGFALFTLSPQLKLDYPEETAASIADAVSEALRERYKVIITAASNAADVAMTDEYARMRGIPEDEMRSRISANIGRLTALMLARYAIGALAVFGGDTLYEIMKHSGAAAVSPLRELAPGIVEAKIISDRRFPRLITKSGGLGGDGAIDAIVNRVF